MAKKRPAPLRVLAAGSNKGGVGKSTVTINMGVAGTLAGEKTLLLDCDPQGTLLL
jgi:chromosome partitioning protein